MPLSSAERKALIEKVQRLVLQNQASAFQNIAEMEKFLGKMYTKAGKEVKAIVQDLYSRMSEWTMAEAAKFGRLTQLLQQINEKLDELGQQEINFVGTNLANMYVDRYLREAYVLGQFINVSVNLNSISSNMVKEAVNYPWSGQMFSERIWENRNWLGRKIREGITQSLILGEGMNKVADRINQHFGNSLFNARRLARTEVMRVCYVAEAKAMKDSDVEYVRYLATTSDERTCRICRQYHDQVYKLGEEPMLPRHPHCRCTYAPELLDIPRELTQTTKEMREARSFEEWRDRAGLQVTQGTVKETKKKTILSNNTLLFDIRPNKEEGIIDVEVAKETFTLPYSEKMLEVVTKLSNYKNTEDLAERYFDLTENLDIDGVSKLQILYHKVYEKMLAFDELFKVDGFEVALDVAMAEELGKNLNNFTEKPTQAEIEALRTYSGIAYRAINMALRRGTDAGQYAQTILDLDSVFQKCTLNEDVLLQRGVDGVALGQLWSMVTRDPKSVIGAVVEDKGFMSTSINAGSRFSGECVFQIKAPKGTRAVYMAEWSKFRREYEVLLPRGTKLKIVDVKKIDGIYHFLMEVVS